MKVTRRMTQSPEAQAAILAQAQAMGISVKDFDTIERGERTMTHKKPTDLIELAHDWERKLTESEQVNAELLAALKVAQHALWVVAPQSLRRDSTPETLCWNRDHPQDAPCNCTSHTIAAAIAKAEGKDPQVASTEPIYTIRPIFRSK